MGVTRTYGQLHFLDLGWERFESLILGMVFKWRRWETINHTGVAGNDGGVDIEAVELLEDGRPCVYHFQCKRYRKLSVATIKKILNDYCDKNPIKADKYVLVTACPLSESCLNEFKIHAKPKGFASVAAWTKPELETMLFTQYYDLLYIFFGVSVVKERSNRISTVRRKISLKHKMEKDFLLSLKEWQDKYREKYAGEDWRTYRLKNPHTKFISSNILIRSIDDTAYPDVDKSLPRRHDGFVKAGIFDFYHNGLAVYTFPYWQDIIVRRQRGGEGEGFLFQPVRAAVLGHIPFSNIIDYDIDGDGYYTYPHVFCDYANGVDPFECIRYAVETDVGNYNILEDHEVAEISKTERQNQIESLLSIDSDEYDDFSGIIICNDCGKELTVNRNTDINDGAWSVYHIASETLEIGDELAVCFDCYPNHCIKASAGDWEQLRAFEKGIEEAANFRHGSEKMDNLKRCFSKLTDYSIREGRSVRKVKIAYHLGELLEIEGTPDFNAAVAALVSWFKPKLQETQE